MVIKVNNFLSENYCKKVVMNFKSDPSNPSNYRIPEGEIPGKLFNDPTEIIRLTKLDPYKPWGFLDFSVHIEEKPDL